MRSRLPPGLPWPTAWTETRVGPKPHYHAGIAVATANAGIGTLPLVVTIPHGVPLVTLRLDDWMRLVAAVKEQAE